MSIYFCVVNIFNIQTKAIGLVLHIFLHIKYKNNNYTII